MLGDFQVAPLVDAMKEKSFSLFGWDLPQGGTQAISQFGVFGILRWRRGLITNLVPREQRARRFVSSPRTQAVDRP